MTAAVKRLVEWRDEEGGRLPPVLKSGNGNLDAERGDAVTKLFAIIERIEAEDASRRNVVEVEIPQGEACEGEGFRCPCLDNGAGYEYGPTCGLTRFKDGEKVCESLDEKEIDGKFFRRAALRSAECRARYGFSGKE